MINCQTQNFVITAAKDLFCTPCYDGVGWQNLKKPYENFTEYRSIANKRFKDDDRSYKG